MLPCMGAYHTEKGISTPRGNKVWNQSTVVSILSNEKYTGNAILQKTYTPDFLTKKRKTKTEKFPSTMLRTVMKQS